MNRRILRLAEERLSVAEDTFSRKLYNTCASELYFALFTLMRAVLSDRHEKRWKHIGIFTAFSRKCVEESILPKELLKEVGQLNQELYYMRRKVDYGEGLDSFDIEVLGDYLSLVKEVFEVVKGRMDLRGS